MEQLRTELIFDTDDVNKRVKAIQIKIKENTYNETSGEGLIDLEFAEYEDCFFVDTQQMRDLLD